MGEEQELVVNMEDGEEEYGEEEADEESPLFRVKTLEMATSTMPWHSSEYSFLEGGGQECQQCLQTFTLLNVINRKL